MLPLSRREGYRKRNSSLAPTCHLGANFWRKKSCFLKRWLHYRSSICSPTKNANPPDSWKTPRSIFIYFRGLFYDAGNDPEGCYYARCTSSSLGELQGQSTF